MAAPLQPADRDVTGSSTAAMAAGSLRIVSRPRDVGTVRIWNSAGAVFDLTEQLRAKICLGLRSMGNF